jgi:hypothetical protein
MNRNESVVKNHPKIQKTAHVATRDAFDQYTDCKERLLYFKCLKTERTMQRFNLLSCIDPFLVRGSRMFTQMPL